MLPSLWNNDDARAFFIEHGYPKQYNDGLLAYLRDLYNVTGSTLPDLLKRHLRDYGDTFAMGVLAKSAVRISLIEPATTFTNASASSAAGGNDTLLTSAGVHGLTSAVSVGSSIYISAGTGWTVGFHTITAIAVDTTGTTIQIDTPFNAGFGVPTIALANTEVPLTTISVPALSLNSMIRTDVTFSATNSSNVKRHRQRLNGLEYSQTQLTTSPQNRLSMVVQNRGDTNSQIAGFVLGNTVGFGSTSAALVTIAADTSIPSVLTITGLVPVENEILTLERYSVELFI